MYASRTTYDLVSHGSGSTDKCYGTWRDATQTGWGPAYQYPCIHSGIIRTSGDITTAWYNYVLATAGTISDENTTSSSPATNTTTATESICPKGWALPSDTQIRSIDKNTGSYISSFSPVLGGYYYSGILSYEDTRGYWWSSTAYNGVVRRALGYDNSALYTTSGVRRNGYYIRCVQKS